MPERFVADLARGDHPAEARNLTIPFGPYIDRHFIDLPVWALSVAGITREVLEGTPYLPGLHAVGRAAVRAHWVLGRARHLRGIRDPPAGGAGDRRHERVRGALTACEGRKAARDHA